MHKAKWTPRQISLLPLVSRPRSIIRQFRKSLPYASEQLQWRIWPTFPLIFFMKFSQKMPLYFFYTMVQKSQKWPKPQIKEGPAFKKKKYHRSFCHVVAVDCENKLRVDFKSFKEACSKHLYQIHSRSFMTISSNLHSCVALPSCWRSCWVNLCKDGISGMYSEHICKKFVVSVLPCVICMRKKGPGKKLRHWAHVNCLGAQSHAVIFCFCFVFHFFVKTMRALDEKQRKNKV